MKDRPKWVIIDWVMAESWPRFSGDDSPLMTLDRYIVSADKLTFVFAMKETHAYVYNAGENKKTFDVRVEYHDSKNVCVKKQYLVPREVVKKVHMGEPVDPPV